MKLSRKLIGCLALLATTTCVFADAPATNAPPAAVNAKTIPLNGANVSSGGKTIIMSGTLTLTGGSATNPAPTGLKLDDYIKDLAAALKLTDTEKKKIEAYYVADGVRLKNILNDDALSPLQQARQASDLRDTRNIKIEALLDDLDRQREFLKIEARYRVALTELAANGGPVAAPPAAK